MEVVDVPPALQQQLGPRGTAALVDVLEQARRDWTMDMIARDTQLRQDSLARYAQLREDMLARDAKSREDWLANTAQLREDMLAGTAKVREDMAELKVDLLKWSFAFWVGQVAAVAAVVGVMLRTMQT